MPPFSQLNSFCLMRGDAIPGLMLKCYCNIVLLHFTSPFLNYNKNQSSLCQIRSYSLLNNNNSFITLLSLLALLNTIQTVGLSQLEVVLTSGIRNAHNHTPCTTRTMTGMSVLHVLRLQGFKALQQRANFKHEQGSTFCHFHYRL